MSHVPHLCKYCSETSPWKFKGSRKNICRICFNKQEANRSRSKYKKIKIDRNVHSLVYTKLKSAELRCFKIGREFNISIEYIDKLLEKQDNKCIYSGINFDNKSKLYTVSIDRINSAKGYTQENIQLVCNCINTMKMDLKEDVFLYLIRKIYSYRKSIEGKSMKIT